MSKITGYVSDIVSQLPETAEALTGINIMNFLNKSQKVYTEKKKQSDNEVISKESSN
ncbi:hypothetical protein [Clostridium sp. JS66]|uniref:hypothetical protein n=1 Tax=Clostridium sp. JS66 TaxID=3064705 RepID=UPI00298DBE38|nr:hypothetical protein [Clostridium sp. JS66]